MERLTERRNDRYIAIKGRPTLYASEERKGGPTSNAIVRRLAAYEDTELKPEEVVQTKLALMGKVLAEIKEFEGVPIERMRELAQAEKDGRLVVLDELRKPLIWGDDAHASILCPECNHDLMGGFPEDEYCEKDMYQCPYCGQPIDSAKAMTREEAEATLKRREEACKVESV